jgi:hypothetical protein
VLLLLDSDKPSIAALLRTCKALKPVAQAAVTKLVLQRWYRGLDALTNLVDLSVSGITLAEQQLPGLESLSGLSRLQLASRDAQELPRP